MQAAHFKMSIKMCNTITMETPDTFSGNCVHVAFMYIIPTLW